MQLESVLLSDAAADQRSTATFVFPGSSLAGNAAALVAPIFLVAFSCTMSTMLHCDVALAQQCVVHQPQCMQCGG